MTQRDPETNPAAFVGAELRRARVAAGFSSQEVLAARLGFDRTVVAKAETGERPPTPEVLAAWCAACELDEDLFGRLALLARRADGPVPSWFEDWLRAEGEAHTLRVWQPLITDGQLSGLVNNGISVAKVSPEGAVVGPLGLVRDGDMVSVDVEARTIDLEVPEAAQRRAQLSPLTLPAGCGWLSVYARSVRPLRQGAALGG